MWVTEAWREVTLLRTFCGHINAEANLIQHRNWNELDRRHGLWFALTKMANWGNWTPVSILSLVLCWPLGSLILHVYVFSANQFQAVFFKVHTVAWSQKTNSRQPSPVTPERQLSVLPERGSINAPYLLDSEFHKRKSLSAGPWGALAFCPPAEQAFIKSERSPLLVNCDSLIAPGALAMWCDLRLTPPSIQMDIKVRKRKKKKGGGGQRGWCDRSGSKNSEGTQGSTCCVFVWWKLRASILGFFIITASDASVSSPAMQRNSST